MTTLQRSTTLCLAELMKFCAKNQEKTSYYITGIAGAFMLLFDMVSNPPRAQIALSRPWSF